MVCVLLWPYLLVSYHRFYFGSRCQSTYRSIVHHRNIGPSHSIVDNQEHHPQVIRRLLVMADHRRTECWMTTMMTTSTGMTTMMTTSTSTSTPRMMATWMTTTMTTSTIMMTTTTTTTMMLMTTTITMMTTSTSMTTPM